ncbi:MAG: hypothetical protein KatS3mg100_501 [Candidatus Parcubacteria bacterium]|nr:MAG: hypothetical protein KatS3mg100_501 [Candidatus Parcubacteria bacterium]
MKRYHPPRPVAVAKRKGYRLHIDRLLYAPFDKTLQVTRTFKLPLGVPAGTEEAMQEVWDAARSDYLRQFGALNLYDAREHSATEDTLTNVWLDVVRAGFVFAPSSAALRLWLRKRYGKGTPGYLEKAKRNFASDFEHFCHARSEYKRVTAEDVLPYISLEKLLAALFGPSEIRRNSTVDGKANQLFDASWQKPEGNAVEVPKEEWITKLQEAYKAYLRHLVDECKRRGKRGDQHEYLAAVFGITREEVVGNDEDIKLTFVPVPERRFIPDGTNPISLILRVSQELKLNLEDGKDVNELLEVLGLNNNQNALSFLLNFSHAGSYETGGSRELLEKSDDEVIRLFRDLYSEEVYKEKWAGREQEFTRRVLWLRDRLREHARQLPTSCFGNGWHNYRRNFGGKIAGWVSNLVGHIFKSTGGGASIKATLKALQDELPRLRDDIRDYIQALSGRGKDPAIHVDAQSLLATLEDFERALSAAWGALDRSELDTLPEQVEVVRLLLAQTRSDVGAFLMRADTHLDPDAIAKRYPALHQTLPRFPVFPGEQRKRRLKEIVATAEHVRVLLQTYNSLYAQFASARGSCAGAWEEKQAGRRAQGVWGVFFASAQHALSPFTYSKTCRGAERRHLPNTT